MSTSTAAAVNADHDAHLASRHAALAVIHAAEDVVVLPARTPLSKAVLAAHKAFEDAERRTSRPDPGGVDGGELMAQSDLLLDIFGNPFRTVLFDPAWRTDTAVALARQMYDSRDFGAMPILADALQDAGCEDEAILDHCRDANATHVRGCWVVDLVVGKE